MRDLDVRQMLRKHLQDRFAFDPETRIIEELGVCQGSVRIDIAVANCALHGYEIKSAADTLQRLPVQAVAYSKIFDHVTIVTAGCHLVATLQIIPDWWGVIRAVEQHFGLSLEAVRTPGHNPGIDPYSVAQLLWREEALALLEQGGWARGVRSKPREQVWRRLVDVLPLTELCEQVRDRLKSREGWRVAAPQP
jgi:hypothetical protein